MKKLQYIIYVALIFLGYSCERELDSEGVSRTTTYLTYDLTGGQLVTVPLGTPFVDPGFKAMEGTTDVTGNVSVDGTVDANKVGLYTLTYSGENSDGFSSSVERNVIIYDPAAPATDLSGDYTSTVFRSSNPPFTYNDLNVTIEKLAPGFFYVSDFLGGFYEQGRDLGSDYALSGYFILNADNTISYVSSYIPGFGDSLNELVGALYDPVTQGIVWDAFYAPNNWDFKVTLVKTIE